MPSEPVDVFIKGVQGEPLDGVLVHIFNPEGSVLFTAGTTDAAGQASFLLETLSYTMRFYRFQTNFAQPQGFDVVAGESNAFDVAGTPWVPPVSNDTRLCRCSGFFRDLDGSPKRNLDIHFITQFDPLILDDAAVVASERHLRTDDDGYGQIDLIKGAIYQARIENLGGNQLRCVKVPDLPGTNLPDILFPIVESIDIAESAPYSVAVDGTLILTPTVFDSGGVPLEGTANQDVQWAVDDRDGLSLIAKETTIELVGLVAGTYELQATRKNESIISIPNLPIVGVPVTITVT